MTNMLSIGLSLSCAEPSCKQFKLWNNRRGNIPGACQRQPEPPADAGHLSHESRGPHGPAGREPAGRGVAPPAATAVVAASAKAC